VVFGFEFNHYELWPHVLTVDPAPLPVPVRAREAGEYTVGSLGGKPSDLVLDGSQALSA
jgi:hypothetical protein